MGPLARQYLGLGLWLQLLGQLELGLVPLLGLGRLTKGYGDMRTALGRHYLGLQWWLWLM